MERHILDTAAPHMCTNISLVFTHDLGVRMLKAVFNQNFLCLEGLAFISLANNEVKLFAWHVNDFFNSMFILILDWKGCFQVSAINGQYLSYLSYIQYYELLKHRVLSVQTTKIKIWNRPQTGYEVFYSVQLNLVKGNPIM